MQSVAGTSPCYFLLPVMVDASVTTEPVPVRVRRSLVRVFRSIFPKKTAPSPVPGTASCAADPLNLQPGDLVEVRPVEEILATLDRDKKSRGVLWMGSMEKFCGQKRRVFKKVEIITLETTGESRNIART